MKPSYRSLGWLTILLVCCIVQLVVGQNPQNEKPNIVLILVDDLGYGDVGPYNEEIDFTPNIDRLADQGMKFTDFHTNGPMCSPTRAALLTGMYQQRLGERFESALNAKIKEKGLPLDVLTIAELLKQNGYATGLFGKWHLGYEEPFIPTNYGFDEFRGLLSGDGDHFTHINRWGVKDWWHNDHLNMEEGYSVDLITRDSNRFIEKHKDKPFFLYVSHLAIHFPWQGPEDPPYRKAGKTYENDKWGIIENPGNVRPHVKSMIQAVDKSVGSIIEKLEQLNLTRETIVIFTSDNGGYTHYYQNEHRFENISDNGPLRGQKTEVFEGGHRVPFIAYWPGKIQPGSENDELTMTMDLFPTFAKATGATIPSTRKTDGLNILPLMQKCIDLPNRTLYWKIGEEWAVRVGKWKIVSENGEKYLFDLSTDLGERKNLYLMKPSIVTEITNKYERWKQDVSQYAQQWKDE